MTFVQVFALLVLLVLAIMTVAFSIVQFGEWREWRADKLHRVSEDLLYDPFRVRLCAFAPVAGLLLLVVYVVGAAWVLSWSDDASAASEATAEAQAGEPAPEAWWLECADREQPCEPADAFTVSQTRFCATMTAIEWLSKGRRDTFWLSGRDEEEAMHYMQSCLRGYNLTLARCTIDEADCRVNNTIVAHGAPWVVLLDNPPYLGRVHGDYEDD